MGGFVSHKLLGCFVLETQLNLTIPLLPLRLLHEQVIRVWELKDRLGGIMSSPHQNWRESVQL